jgi:uncharacterized membrane protein
MPHAELAESLLLPLAVGARILLEFLSVLSVLYGLGALLRQTLPSLLRRLPLRPSNRARLTLGTWLALALEFQLAADIVSTVVSPTQQNLLQLGAVALIRTFLNVFLARELEAEMRMEREDRIPPTSAAADER